MKVLFTTPILEHPAAGGPQLRIENSIKALARVCDLHIVSRVRQAGLGGAPGEAFYRSLCPNFVYAPPVSGQPVDIAPWKGLPLSRQELMIEVEAKFIIDYAERHGIDLIWFGYGNISFPLIRTIKRARPSLKAVVDTDSVWSRFILRELPLETDPKRRAEIERAGRFKEIEESQWVNLCEATLAVSEVDAEYYRGLTADPARVHVFANVIDVDSYHDRPAPPPDFKRPSIYLAGTFGHAHSPMDRAARWIVEEVLPKVRAEIPDVHFYIVGRNSNVSLADLAGQPGITVTGKLPSVLPYLCNVDVALVPLKFESGTRFKILEGGACRVPMVSTVLGAEGIPVTDGQDILIADEPGDFAAAILRLLRDRAFAQSMADRLCDLVREQYSVDTLVRQATAILDAVGSAPPAPVLEPARTAVAPASASAPPAPHLIAQGAALLQEGRLAEAAVIWRRLVETHPENPDLVNNLAVTLKRLERWHEAATVFRRLVRLRPGDAQAHFNLGLARLHTGHPDEAAAAWEAALAANPAHREARANLHRLRQAPPVAQPPAPMRVGLYRGIAWGIGGGFQYEITLLDALVQVGREQSAASADDMVCLSTNEDSLRSLLASGKASYDGLPVRLLSEMALRQAPPERYLQALPKETDVPASPDQIIVSRQLGERLRQEGVDWVFQLLPSLAGVSALLPFVTPIHDLNHRLQPEFPEVSALGEIPRREYTYNLICKYATLVVVDSEVGKEDVLNFYGHLIDEDRIRVLPYVPSSFRSAAVTEEDKRRVVGKYGLPPRFFFYPAQFWRHKNHIAIVEALRLIEQHTGEKIPVVFCGTYSDGLRARTFMEIMNHAQKVGVRERIHYLGFVPDNDIPALYSLAVGLAMPTFFGPTNIPPLEAWQYGCPVITSNIRGLRDQAGDAALLVDPRAPATLAEAMLTLWRQEGLRRELAERGRRRLARHSWSEFVGRVGEVVEEASARIRDGHYPRYPGNPFNDPVR
ncbi:MAG TPA: glycosyltransferase [Azospirillum sp.]|nr:glycosyltransferase [Azospirillum sp.]